MPAAHAATRYVRHAPERTLLYTLVEAHYPDFIARIEAEDRSLPEYVGEESPEMPVDVRILSATRKKLARLVEDGRFRQNLYYRINVIELPVPPLRERAGDIPAIATAELARLAAELGEALQPLSPAAIEALAQYAFPGNMRELENILERAVALCEGEHLGIL